MASETFDKYVKRFSKGLPNNKVIFLLVFFTSLIFGTTTIALIHYKLLEKALDYILLRGAIFSLISILLPTLLATLFIKILAKNITLRHILFISFIGEISFSIYLVFSSLIEIAFGESIAILVLILGIASIYGWWLFTSKVLFTKKTREYYIPFIQPTLYLLFYVFSLGFVFSEYLPINALLIKLYSGIFVFTIVIYLIFYAFNKPSKKSLGFNAMEVFSAMFRDWLFNITTTSPFGKYGTYIDLRVDILIFIKNRIKAIFFIPGIHYGPMGNLCGSNFPYLLEDYTEKKYKIPLFAMHSTTNEDLNPVSAAEINKFKSLIRNEIKYNAGKNSRVRFEKGRYRNSRVTALCFDKVSLVTFSRAPAITEDITPEASSMFKLLLDKKIGESILIDAHNSRYETAKKQDLENIKIDSRTAKEYINAIDNLKQIHDAKEIKLGIGKVELYKKLKKPLDLAQGSLNIAIFQLNSFKYAIVQFNSNNIFPSLRNKIIKYMKKKGIDAEVYTTDTHAVNSISIDASNVLGKFTSFNKLVRPLNEATEQALKNMEVVKIRHEQKLIRNFKVWGYNSRAKMLSVTNAILSISKIIIPTIILSGFVIAGLIIYLID
ncbi:MAG: DUF2070 family protein [Candidatus Micrarchaeaceae archaeon]